MNGKARTRVYKIRAQAGGPWMAACPMCVARVSEGNSGFVHGGQIGRKVVMQLAGQLPTACQMAIVRSADLSQTA